MNFPYLKLPGSSKRPLVPTLFKYNNKSLDHPILCLVDSGADVSYLDITLARELEVDLSRIKSVPSWGINGEKFVGFPAEIVAEIGGWEFTIAVIFSKEITRAFCVLGQAGLFDQCRISFERYKWNLEIKPRPGIN